MKVLITHELFPPDIRGGGEKVVYEIAKRLLDSGFEIKVVTTGNPKIRKFNGIPTIRLPINRYLMNFAAPWLIKYAKDADLIQTNNYNACYPSYIAAKMTKKPIICLVHGMYGNKWIKMRGPLLGFLSKGIERLQILHNFNKILFLSDFARDAALSIGVKKELTEIIKPGIEFKKYRMGKKEPFVLFAGRLAKQKGLENLIDAAKRIPDTKFLIAGRGEMENQLKSVAPSNVEFLGFVSDEKLVDLYSRALVFCAPSVAETFGFTILEAMASGCAIVSTIPLAYEGIRIDSGNAAKLKTAIEKLINNKYLAIRMGRENRRRAKAYSWKNFMKNLVELYEEILRKR